ncbi:hypothetical protein ACIQNG_00395 [Streptomyces sp. NPDC091377]|uniref:hypothetical protein n=1 Tax=Streptomyces sp. NPDC091377 TaxID=3365995 RepID=UPI003807E83A
MTTRPDVDPGSEEDPHDPSYAPHDESYDLSLSDRADDDDPLTVILRPAADRLAAPPGRYEAIRRKAARRRVVRAAVGAGATCAVAVLIALPVFRQTAPEDPREPAVPMAPDEPAPGVSEPPPTEAPTPSPSEPGGSGEARVGVTPSSSPPLTRGSGSPTTIPTPTTHPPSPERSPGARGEPGPGDQPPNGASVDRSDAPSPAVD